MTTPAAHASIDRLSRGLTFLLAAAISVTVANLYYAQPIVTLISQSLGLSPGAAGLVVTLTQAGYGIGVLLVVPLGDIVEIRRLIMSMMAVTILGLIGLVFSGQPLPYFAAAFATGVGASLVQALVPYAANLAPEERRGQVVGTLMSGLMLGIMLARPISSLLTGMFSWQAVFLWSAALMSALACVLYVLLPPRQPTTAGVSYGQLLKSMAHLYATTPILRQRAIYQALIFGAFCLFWTASPMLLAGPEFRFSQSGIALFALVGVAGAVSAPFAGRAADRGWSDVATALALICASISFVLGQALPAGTPLALGALVVAAILLDAGVTANLVLGQRAIFSLSAEYRSRLNGLYVATIFVGGATGSALGAWTYARGGWHLASWTGFVMPTLAFAYFALAWRGRKVSGAEGEVSPASAG